MILKLFGTFNQNEMKFYITTRIKNFRKISKLPRILSLSQKQLFTDVVPKNCSERFDKTPGETPVTESFIAGQQLFFRIRENTDKRLFIIQISIQNNRVRFELT